MKVHETVHAGNSSEDESPNFRVNFWERTEGGSWNLDAFVVSETRDVKEVLDWIQRNANGREFELFVEVGDEPMGPFEVPRTSGLIRLYGENPN